MEVVTRRRRSRRTYDAQVDNRSFALGPRRRGHPAIKAKLRSFLENVLERTGLTTKRYRCH